MRKHFSILLMFLFSVGFTANCMGEKGSGKLASESREIKDVTGVELATIGELHIQIGDEDKLTVEADENILKYITTEVHNGMLEIDLRHGSSLSTKQPIKYYLTVKSLNRIVVSSSGDVYAPDVKADEFAISLGSSGDLSMGNITADKVAINISSSGDARLGDVAAKTVDANLSSSGDLHINGGNAGEQSINLSSSGDYKAENMTSSDARLALSSSGDAYVNVSNSISAVLSSSGSVYYSGNPQVKKVESSSGEVERMSD